jgi:hypothetical protein
MSAIDNPDPLSPGLGSGPTDGGSFHPDFKSADFWRTIIDNALTILQATGVLHDVGSKTGSSSDTDISQYD